MTTLLRFLDGAMMSRLSLTTTNAQTQKPPHNEARMPSKVVEPQQLAWRETTAWKSTRSPLLSLLHPAYVGILDKIFSSNSGLELQDHIAFSGTCRSMRAVYTERVWQSLMDIFIAPPYDASNPVYAAKDRIFSNAFVAATLDPAQAVELAAAAYPGVKVVMPGAYTSSKAKTVVFSFKTEAIRWVNEPTMTLTEAKASWKVNDAQLANISFTTSPNHHHPLGADIRHYKVAAVRRIALQAHGGPVGHDTHVLKLQRTAQKKAANKALRAAAA